jgi:hypothetical protein
MNNKKKLYTTPKPSTSFISEAFLDYTETDPMIRYEYLDNKTTVARGIKFINTYALKTRSERCCSVWHIEDAFDTLLEIENSSWIEEVSRDIPLEYRSDWKPRHFMIYLDSVGSFEFLAEDWLETEAP